MFNTNGFVLFMYFRVVRRLREKNFGKSSCNLSSVNPSLTFSLKFLTIPERTGYGDTPCSSNDGCN